MDWAPRRKCTEGLPFVSENLKKSVVGKKFKLNDEGIAVTEAYFEEHQKTYFSDVLNKLENLWDNFIELKGEYVDK